MLFTLHFGNGYQNKRLFKLIDLNFMIYRIFKRVIDLIFSIIGLIIISPLLFILFIVLCIKYRGHAIYKQVRPGRAGQSFTLFKFKTMNDNRDVIGNLLPDADRLTSIGKFIRKTSLDELPQLFNVLIGDMSLVGPRPLLIQYLQLYDKKQKRRHEVKPGITGWAQVNGRNAITWEQKFEYDVWYVDNLSFLLDMKILFLTLKKVLIREGINQAGQATAEPFKGTK